jgi:glycine cleavage system H protein
MDIPNDRKYQKTHEWVVMEGKTAIIGITDYAQSSLGDIVYVELPETGIELSVGDEIATIESVKAASPIYAAVNGVVTEVNEELESTPELINQKPYDAFIVKMEITGSTDDTVLLDAAGYAAMVAEESS